MRSARAGGPDGFPSHAAGNEGGKVSCGSGGPADERAGVDQPTSADERAGAGAAHDTRRPGLISLPSTTSSSLPADGAHAGQYDGDRLPSLSSASSTFVAVRSEKEVNSTALAGRRRLGEDDDWQAPTSDAPQPSPLLPPLIGERPPHEGSLDSVAPGSALLLIGRSSDAPPTGSEIERMDVDANDDAITASLRLSSSGLDLGSASCDAGAAAARAHLAPPWPRECRVAGCCHGDVHTASPLVQNQCSAVDYELERPPAPSGFAPNAEAVFDLSSSSSNSSAASPQPPRTPPLPLPPQQSSPGQPQAEVPPAPLTREQPPPEAMESPLQLLNWYTTRSGAQTVFGANIPSSSRLEAAAKRYPVEQLEDLRHRLSMAKDRHGDPSTDSYVAFLLTPVGYELAPGEPRTVMVIGKEGKCGIHTMTYADCLRNLGDDSAENELLELEGFKKLRSGFVITRVAEVRPPAHPAAAAASATNWEDDNEDDDAPTVASTCTTVNVGAGLAHGLLDKLPKDSEYLLIVYNKMVFCRQVFNVAEDGRLVIVCCDLCDEAAAAESARNIVASSLKALPKDAIINPTAMWLPFHESGTSPEARRTCGRRGVPCHEYLELPTDRDLPLGVRDGAFEALADAGVKDAGLFALPHLGWILAKETLSSGEEVEVREAEKEEEDDDDELPPRGPEGGDEEESAEAGDDTWLEAWLEGDEDESDAAGGSDAWSEGDEDESGVAGDDDEMGDQDESDVDMSDEDESAAAGGESMDVELQPS